MLILPLLKINILLTVWLPPKVIPKLLFIVRNEMEPLPLSDCEAVVPLKVSALLVIFPKFVKVAPVKLMLCDPEIAAPLATK